MPMVGSPGQGPSSVCVTAGPTPHPLTQHHSSGFLVDAILEFEGALRSLGINTYKRKTGE